MNTLSTVTAATRPPRIPVTIISGYLGAGKTTLINRILRDNGGERLAILVNDFGSINIDSDLIASHDGTTISLTNGCVCCSIANDLRGALLGVVAMEPAPTRILIETSGVADPARIANDARGQSTLGLDGIIVLADSETVQARCADRYVGRTVQCQLEAADLIIMTKGDLVAATSFDATEKWLNTTFAGKPIMTTTACRLAEIVTGRTVAGLDSQISDHRLAPHDDGQHRALTLTCPEPVDRATLCAALEQLGADVLRCKGWLRFTDQRQQVDLVQGVGARLEFTSAEPNYSGQKLGLVVICRNEGRSYSRVAEILPGAVGASTHG